MREQIDALIAKWRDAAQWELESGSPEFGKGLAARHTLFARQNELEQLVRYLRLDAALTSSPDPTPGDNA